LNYLTYYEYLEFYNSFFFLRNERLWYIITTPIIFVSLTAILMIIILGLATIFSYGDECENKSISKDEKTPFLTKLFNFGAVLSFVFIFGGLSFVISTVPVENERNRFHLEVSEKIETEFINEKIVMYLNPITGFNNIPPDTYLVRKGLNSSYHYQNNNAFDYIPEDWIILFIESDKIEPKIVEREIVPTDVRMNISREPLIITYVLIPKESIYLMAR